MKVRKKKKNRNLNNNIKHILVVVLLLFSALCTYIGYFEVFVENGQKVKKGQKLMSIDLEFLKKNAPSIASPILCTDLKNNQKVRRIADGNIKAGEPLLAIDIYEK